MCSQTLSENYLIEEIPTYSNSSTPEESKFIKGPDALHVTKSVLPLLESEEKLH